MRAKCIHLPHQALTFECADRGLIRDREKNAHRPVERGEGLFLFEGVAFGERFERGRDQAQRIERELEFRSRRARFDLLMNSTQAIAHFFRLQDRHRLVEGRRIEIQKQRQSNRLQIANSIRRLHWRAGQHALAPGLMTQIVREYRRELFQFIDVGRIAKEGEREFAGLLEIAIINF